MCLGQFPTEVRVTTCDWCSLEREVQQIEQELYLFWLRAYTARHGHPGIRRKYICQGCLTFLDNFYRFVETCRNNRSMRERERAADAERERV